MEASKECIKMSHRVDAPDADVQMVGRAIELPTNGKTSTVHCRTSHGGHWSGKPYTQIVDSIRWRSRVKKLSTRGTMKCLSADGPFLIVADQACEWQSLVQAKCRALTTDTLCFSFLTDLRRLHSSQSIHADYIFKYRFTFARLLVLVAVALASTRRNGNGVTRGPFCAMLPTTTATQHLTSKQPLVVALAVSSHNVSHSLETHCTV